MQLGDGTMKTEHILFAMKLISDIGCIERKFTPIVTVIHPTIELGKVALNRERITINFSYLEEIDLVTCRTVTTHDERGQLIPSLTPMGVVLADLMKGVVVGTLGWSILKDVVNQDRNKPGDSWDNTIQLCTDLGLKR